MITFPSRRGYFEMRRRLAFVEDVVRLHLLKLMAEELMLLEASCQKPSGDAFNVNWVQAT
jgi:hypothetical protein